MLFLKLHLLKLKIHWLFKKRGGLKVEWLEKLFKEVAKDVSRERGKKARSDT